MTVEEILKKLEMLGNPENVAGMARYGIVSHKAFGVRSPDLRALSKEVKKRNPDRHSLALQLWQTGVHDARALAYLIEDPKLVTRDQMDSWVSDFDNWAICDSTCGNLFRRAPFAHEKAREWLSRDEEFVKRAGIVLIAWLAVHDKKVDDKKIAEFLPYLEAQAKDGRNFVKKAVSWALRQVGKRSLYLNNEAIETAKRIKTQNTAASQWIAAHALRELNSENVKARLEKKRLKKKRLK